jgi:hypothetical protein
VLRAFRRHRLAAIRYLRVGHDGSGTARIVDSHPYGRQKCDAAVPQTTGVPRLTQSHSTYSRPHTAARRRDPYNRLGTTRIRSPPIRTVAFTLLGRILKLLSRPPSGVTPPRGRFYLGRTDDGLER